jgi:hypothetical protein
VDKRYYFSALNSDVRMVSIRLKHFSLIPTKKDESKFKNIYKIHSLRSLSYGTSIAASKASSTQSAI